MLIIDGHNLIPKIPGWSLRAIDDEERLIRELQRFASLRGRQIEVFFDGAPPGYSGERMYGGIRAHFVLQGRTADEAIRKFVAAMGKSARGVRVVTSDRQVQAEVRALGAAVITSEDFARQLLDMRAELDFNAAKARSKRGKGPAAGKPAAEAESAAAEEAGAPPKQKTAAPEDPLSEWYNLFGVDPSQAEKPVVPAPSPAKPPAARKGPRSRSRHGFPKK